MFNFFFHSFPKSRVIIALEIANERLRTLEIEEEKGVVRGGKGEAIEGFEQSALPFSVERIAKAVLQSVGSGECVIAVHPELAPLCLVSVRIALEGKETRISARDERELTARAYQEADSAARSLEAERTGLRAADLMVAEAVLQERLIDGYPVDRFLGFSGDVLECTVACCVTNRAMETTLASLFRVFKERGTRVRFGYEGMIYAERARNAKKSGIVLFIGYASSLALVFDKGYLKNALPIPWGTRELFLPFRDTFGMGEHTAKELIERYEKKVISEALRQKTGELMLPPLKRFATLVQETLLAIPSHSRLAVEILGECARIPELQECFHFRKTHVLTPKNAGVSRDARLASDPAFTLLSMSALNAHHKILDLTAKTAAVVSDTQADFSSPKKKTERSLTFRVLAILSAGAFLGLLTGGALWHIVFQRARVTIIPQTRNVTTQLVFSADQNQTEINIENNALPATVLVKEKEAVRVFPATGKKEKETYAEGVIRVFNTQANKNQILVANTRFIAANGKLFKTTERVTVPPGFLDVRVKAAEPGEAYDIEPTTFSLPGLAGTSLYTLIYGKSTQPMAGGSKTSVTVVTEGDIANAQLALNDNLTKQAKEMIRSLLSKEDVWLTEFTRVWVVESKPLVKAGAELEQFNISSKVRVSALVFNRQEAANLLKSALLGLLQSEEQLKESSVRVAFKGERFRENADAGDVAGTIEGTFVRIVDAEVLGQQLAGRSKNEAKAILGAHSALKEFRIELSPFWKRTLPARSSRIEISTGSY